MLISVATQVTQYTITVVFVAALDPLLGLMGVTIAVLAVLGRVGSRPRVRVRSLVARETNSDLTSRIQEVLGAARVVKAHGMEATEQKRFEADSVVAFTPPLGCARWSLRWASSCSLWPPQSCLVASS